MSELGLQTCWKLLSEHSENTVSETVVHLPSLMMSVIFNVMQGCCLHVLHVRIIHKIDWKEAVSNC